MTAARKLENNRHWGERMPLALPNEVVHLLNIDRLLQRARLTNRLGIPSNDRDKTETKEVAACGSFPTTAHSGTEQTKQALSAEA